MSDPFGYDECSPESPCEACRTRHPNGWPTLPDPRDARIAELEAIRDACIADSRSNQQILGRALGYPELDGSVVVGPNSIGSLCDEAAERIAKLEALIVEAAGWNVMDDPLHAEADRIRARA